MATDAEYVFAAIARTRNMLFRHATPIVRAHNLTMGQFEVLEALSAHGPMTVGQVRDTVFGTKGNIPLVIKNLERAGLVNRSASQEDARASVIALTKDGTSCIESVYPQVVASIEHDLSALTEQEKCQLVQLLGKVRKATQTEEQTGEGNAK